jgi:uncharacterized protein
VRPRSPARRFPARLGAAIAAVALAVASPLSAIDVPYLSGRVVDEAGVLGTEARGRIEAALAAHEGATTDQVAVLVVPSLGGDTIEEYAERVFRTWKLGSAERDNGVLLLVSTGDRRLRIEVGYGLEERLTDGAAGSIIRTAIAPRFKAGDYDGGVEDGVRAIVGVLEGVAGSVPPEAAGGSATPSARGFADLETPDMPWHLRILLGAFIFGIIGLFTVIGVLTPRSGWFLYFFLIPFWAMFPIIIVGSRGALALLGTYLTAFPLAKLWARRQPWYAKAAQELKTKGRATVGGFTVTSGGSSGGFSGGGGGFSGGGGSSGGGGASGGW